MGKRSTKWTAKVGKVSRTGAKASRVLKDTMVQQLSDTWHSINDVSSIGRRKGAKVFRRGLENGEMQDVA